MAKIHPLALVEAGAELADDVTIGPFCLVGPKVKSVLAPCSIRTWW